MWWEVVAGAAVVASALNIFPQIIKTYHQKRARDLSYGMMSVISIGNVLWIAHGLHRGDRALIIANAVLLLSAVTLALLKRAYDARTTTL